MSPMLSYEECWRDWRSGPPLAIAADHHSDNTLRPHLQALCNEADASDQRVLLVAGDQLLDKDTAAHRELAYLVVESRQERRSGHVEPVDADGGIDRASERLRTLV